MSLSIGRDLRIDFIKGFCILLMVWGHLPPMGAQTKGLWHVTEWIYTFHMPVFIVITGYLFGKKVGEWSEAKSVVRRMLKPYLTLAILSMLLYWVAARLGFSTSVVAPVSNAFEMFKWILQGRGGGALWYLYTFGIVELLVLEALFWGRKSNGSFDIVAVIVLAGGCAGLLQVMGFNVWAHFVPYFLVGFAIRRFDCQLPSSWWFALATPIVWAFLDVRTTSVFNYVWVFAVFGLLMRVADSANARFVFFSNGITFLGRHTLAILLFHNILSVGLRPMSQYVLRVEGSGIGLNFLLLVVIVSGCLVIEYMWKRCPYLNRLIW